MALFRRAKTAPTPYPRLVFHLLRLGQFLAGIVVSAIMFYFIWNLIHEHFETPKTFWTLLAASLLTLLTLLASTALYACFGLSPRINLLLNTILLIMWSPGFGFLWYYSRGTLSHVCNKATWTGPTGIMVCRIYKALFAFSMVGFFTTLLALLLDVFVWRKATARGKYEQMGGQDKPQGIASGNLYNEPHYSDSRNSISLGGYTSGQQPRDKNSGYEVPEEQFNYDTSYHGSGHPTSAAPTPPPPQAGQKTGTTGTSGNKTSGADAIGAAFG